jgi:uncharacterized protein YhjY with autotransporter beta-barrel domain
MGCRLPACLAAMVLAGIPVIAMGQVTQAPGLTDPDLITQFASLEQRSAQANQAVYDRMIQPDIGCNDRIVAPTATCTAEIFAVFEEVRELVHTANELNGTGPTLYSLGLDSENLGFALRWTAGEELAAQEASVKDFKNSQLAVLYNRITALRLQSRGITTSADVDWQQDRIYAATENELTGSEGSIASRWGAFIDGSFGYGNKDDSTFAAGFEDAFDFDSQELTLGLDYRVNDRLVFGLLGGYTDKEVDFDSLASIVDGRIKADGFSVIGYGLWESGAFYVTGSLGGQALSYDLSRRITYPSFNPLIAPKDVTTLSDTDSTAWLATLSGGYDWQVWVITVEPYLKAEYIDIDIDGFSETSESGFNFVFGDQNIKSFDTAAGLRFSYVWTPPFGVVIPYLRGELHKDFEDESRVVSSIYTGITGVDFSPADDSPDFAIPTDDQDAEYSLVAGGFSLVLPMGLQGYLQYQRVFGLTDFAEGVITGGVRFEF